MLRIRPFKRKELKQLLTWFDDEESFTKWSAGIFSYPLNMEVLLNYFSEFEEDENSFIMAAIDENGNLAGHFIMRNADYENNSIHLGLIALEPKYRGKGYGREMLSLGLKYAVEILKVERVTLKVFDCNSGAHRCYKSVGMQDISYSEDSFIYKNEKWGVYDMEYISR